MTSTSVSKEEQSTKTQISSKDRETPHISLPKDDSEDSNLTIGEDSLQESWKPDLPPRRTTLELLNVSQKSPTGSLKIRTTTNRPKLQSTATTALSLADADGQLHSDEVQKSFAPSLRSTPSHKSLRSYTPRYRSRSGTISETDDTTSILSYHPLPGGSDAESILGDLLSPDQRSPQWLFSQGDKHINHNEMPFDNNEPKADFNREFDEIADVAADGSNEAELMQQWKSKRKHFLILSAAGKPIFNRHGSDNLISGYIGIIQTIFSFFESSNDQLKSFSAGKSRFVALTRGPLYLVAISRLGESDSQLRVQLDSLYMQILSTLTLPTLENLFSKRPSTDLRRPLQGTESLLAALADSFTRGSPSTLLSALECLKLRKRDREAINNAMLQVKCKDLLYGLMVAGGRLVSVIRPRSHSLHPGDLQLIFNMLFEAGSVKASEGESWIPMCLPGFNKNGYLYMYVRFLDVLGEREREEVRKGTTTKEDRIAILLISANKEGFYELQSMATEVIHHLEKNNKLNTIKSAITQGRSSTTDIVPGTVLQHFLYKSRGNLQYVMPSYEPSFTTLLERRRLLSVYHALHAGVHAKTGHLKVYHCISREHVALAWVTPMFELYCIAHGSVERNALAQAANKVIEYIRSQEERVFIIGGVLHDKRVPKSLYEQVSIEETIQQAIPKQDPKLGSWKFYPATLVEQDSTFVDSLSFPIFLGTLTRGL